VRVEAGFNLGELIVRREGADKAVQVWWRDVVQPFLLDPTVAPTLLGGSSQGRYWMARTLVRVGDLLEQEGSLRTQSAPGRSFSKRSLAPNHWLAPARAFRCARRKTMSARQSSSARASSVSGLRPEMNSL